MHGVLHAVSTKFLKCSVTSFSGHTSATTMGTSWGWDHFPLGVGWPLVCFQIESLHKLSVWKINVLKTELSIWKINVLKTELSIWKINVLKTELSIWKINVLKTELSIWKINVLKTELSIWKINVLKTEVFRVLSICLGEKCQTNGHPTPRGVSGEEVISYWCQDWSIHIRVTPLQYCSYIVVTTIIVTCYFPICHCIIDFDVFLNSTVWYTHWQNSDKCWESVAIIIANRHDFRGPSLTIFFREEIHLLL